VKVAEWKGAEAPRQAALRKELEGEGYSVYAWTDGPGTTYPPHTHDDDQSHWIVSGALALTVDGKEYVLEAGDRDWLPAGTVHSARVVGAGSVTYLVGAKARAE
jgi:quercetin dioxygenase-like cupin family protein